MKELKEALGGDGCGHPRLSMGMGTCGNSSTVYAKYEQFIITQLYFNKPTNQNFRLTSLLLFTSDALIILKSKK